MLTEKLQNERFSGINKGEQINSRIDIGSVWNNEQSGTYMLIAANADLCALVGLMDGNRYVDAVKCETMFHLTQEEFKKVCGNDKFTKIKNSPYKY